MKFRVWGKINGMKFDQVFDSIIEWKAERVLIEKEFNMFVVVYGMQSVEG